MREIKVVLVHDYEQSAMNGLRIQMAALARQCEEIHKDYQYLLGLVLTHVPDALPEWEGKEIARIRAAER